MIYKSRLGFSLFTILAVTMLFLLQGCSLVSASTLRADPIDSQVVDAKTGKPIQGAIVVAYWELHPGSLGGDALPCAAANVEEAVTDKDGKFHLPGWGPIKGSCGGMRQGDPLLFVFKSGYGYGRFSNGWGGVELLSVTRNEWANRQMKLKKFPNLDLRTHGVGSYAANFGDFNSDIAMFIVDMPGECNWKKIPNMLRAIITQRKAFIAVGNYDFDGSLDLMLTEDGQDKLMRKIAPQCGSPKEYVEELGK